MRNLVTGNYSLEDTIFLRRTFFFDSHILKTRLKERERHSPQENKLFLLTFLVPYIEVSYIEVPLHSTGSDFGSLDCYFEPPTAPACALEAMTAFRKGECVGSGNDDVIPTAALLASGARCVHVQKEDFGTFFRASK